MTQIDTGEGIPGYVDLLRQTLQDEGNVKISTVVITHHHHDHVGGIGDVCALCGAPIRLTKFTEIPTLNETPGGQVFESLRDGQVLETEGATLRVIHTPGHTKDHLCLYLEEDKAMFSGDSILGQGTAVFENLRSYMVSLEKLLPFAPERIYPGHGPVVEDGLAKIKEYISHRNAREQQIVDCMRRHAGKSLTAMEMVKEIYSSYPVALHDPAKGSVLHHLQKLEEEGRVVRLSPEDEGSEETFRLHQEGAKI